MKKEKKEKDEKKVKGGIARSEALTKTERSAIAKKAASVRWGTDLPEATHTGNLKVGQIPCAVLEDGTRVLWQQGFLRAIGRTGRAAESAVLDESFPLPVFLRAENLKPFITSELVEASRPIVFRPIISSRGGISYGYRAELLPQVCDVFVQALEAKALKPNQIHIAEQCKILMRGFAQVGIIALVDEATGYQYTRARNALEEILEHFIAKELRKWVKTFPDEFYYHICRLKGWNYDEDNKHKRGAYFGKLTNYLIYRRLAPGVLKELKSITPKDSKGRYKQRLFQRLTEHIGHPRLRELLASEITLMRIFDNGKWEDFEKALNRAIPIYGDLPLFDQIENQNTDTARLLH
ncbi:MAG TPA: P63C domain-containing protein [Pyrinomonadaceae bacterium]|jgi:hypothetical protein